MTRLPYQFVRLALGCSLIAIQSARPEWMRFLPVQTWAQISILIGMLILGALLQWKLTPKRKQPQSGPPTGVPNE